MLSKSNTALIEQHPLGFTATVSPDGSPNVSPKGTFVVIDESHLAFGEIRSPQTIENLKTTPSVEVNFVDVLSRKGIRIKGQATIYERSAERYNALLQHFTPWPDLQPRMRHIVVIDIDQVKPLSSPAYDDGASEADLRAHWTNVLVGK